MRSTMFRSTMIAAMLAASCAAAARAEDTEALRSLERAYVEAWMANDRHRVMNTVASDAVIIPSRMQPIRGREAIEAFWFPDDGSTTTVTSYRTVVHDAHVSGDVGWLFGTGELSFVWEKDDERTEASQASTFTMIARRDASGVWRIVHRAWSDAPRRE